MANELARYKTLDGEELALTADDIRDQFCPKATDKELAVFAGQAKMFQANPWANEIYLVKYKDSPASTILSYHVFNRIATSQKDYDGIESGVIVFNQKTGQVMHNDGSAYFPAIGQTLVGGWAKVYRKGISHPFTSTVNLQDFDKGTANWKSMKAFMIEKVAKAQAWRLAYPSLFANVYDASEVEKYPKKSGEWTIADPSKANRVETVGDNGELVGVYCEPNTGELIEEYETVEVIEENPLQAAKQELWTACKVYTAATGKDPKEIADMIKAREDYEETEEFLSRVADELISEAEGIGEQGKMPL